LQPIETSNDAFSSNAELADAARARILEVLDEPDLLLSDSLARH